MVSVTVVVQIGNTDDKLTQKKWASFVASMNEVVRGRASCVHFCGHSDGNAVWQNWCIVATVDEAWVENLRATIEHCRKRYDQDSAAVMFGNTEFI